MSMISSLSTIWYEEQETDHLILKARIESVQADCCSDYQHISIITTHQFGRTLVLDGQTQSSAADEHIYHESLVHPAMLMAHRPKTVFIGGGGELATAREVLRHSSVERVVMVDLDQAVVDLSRRYLPSWGGDDVATNPRLTIIYTDAFEYLKSSSELFDVIIIDVSDPIECGPAVALYTREFYQLLASKLTRDGIMVTQAGPGSVHNADECFAAIFQTMKTVFGTEVKPYTIEIPSFGSHWAFVLASSCVLDESGIDDKIENAGLKSVLQHYDHISHTHMFSLTRGVRSKLENEKRIITKDSPIFY